MSGSHRRRKRGPGQERPAFENFTNGFGGTSTRSERRRQQAAHRVGFRDWQGREQVRSLPPHVSAAWNRASEDDADWFKGHPWRSHRLRPAIQHELPSLSDIAGKWIAIQQVVPGLRVKVIFTPPSPPPDNEDIAHALFDLVHEHGAAGISEIPAETIMARAYTMSVRGRS
jgi:hypothetical protein